MYTGGLTVEEFCAAALLSLPTVPPTSYFWGVLIKDIIPVGLTLPPAAPPVAGAANPYDGLVYVGKLVTAVFLDFCNSSYAGLE